MGTRGSRWKSEGSGNGVGGGAPVGSEWVSGFMRICLVSRCTNYARSRAVCPVTKRES